MRDLYALMGLLVLNHSAFSGGRVAVSLFAQSLGAQAALVGILVALYSLLPMLASVRIGRWIDRIGVRNPLLLGSVLVIIGSALPALAPTLEMLFVSCILVGAGAMLFHVSVNLAVGAMGRPEDRAINFSFLALAFSSSGFSGPMIAGFGIDHIGHRATFAVLAAMPLVPVLVLLVDRVRLPRTAGAEAAPGKSHVFDLFRDRTLRRVFIASGLLSMAWDLFTFVTPIYGHSAGLSASTIGAILGAFAAATFVVRLFMPFFARRLSAWSTLTFSLATSGAVFVLFPLVDAVPLLFVLAFVLGIGLGCAQPMVMAVLYAAAPAGRQGEAVGVRTTLINLSQTLFPLVFGALGSAVGIAPVFWALAASLLGGSVFAARGGARGAAPR
jgi:predicted MFS family arabinose efflux permease